MEKKILVFDSHPVQYRVPVWKAIHAKMPSSLKVVYASDCSVRGYADAGFGQTFAWDEPMLEGYEYQILNCEKGKPLSGWGSLTGDGVRELIDTINPSAILLTGLNYKYDLVAYRSARKKGIAVWLRCETQDEAVKRSPLKSIIRSLIYRAAYKRIDKIFYIGKLNREHYLKHGVPLSKLYPALYGTIDRFEGIDNILRQQIRDLAREKAGADLTSLVIGFSGKFIPKKNPDILFDMLSYLPEEIRKKTLIYFVGSGEMDSLLKRKAGAAFADFGVKAFFSGFVNQSKIADHYLAMDIMVLPSRRMGETWGLVANEGMQAGCSVIVSEGVGSGKDFNDWERFEVIRIEDPKDLALKIVRLSGFSKDFNWAANLLKPYSIQATAEELIKQLG